MEGYLDMPDENGKRDWWELRPGIRTATETGHNYIGGSDRNFLSILALSLIGTRRGASAARPQGSLAGRQPTNAPRISRVPTNGIETLLSRKLILPLVSWSYSLFVHGKSPNSRRLRLIHKLEERPPVGRDAPVGNPTSISMPARKSPGIAMPGQKKTVQVDVLSRTCARYHRN
jgi:hypothetical protein